MGVIPQLEVWGFSTTLSKLGETMLVATREQAPEGLRAARRLSPAQGRQRFRRPAAARRRGDALLPHERLSRPTPPRETINDADRVYPGDGVAPLTQILHDLFATGFRGTLSLELFNPHYWKQDAESPARGWRR